MQRRSSPSLPLTLVLFLGCYLATRANRVYVHPFYLFAGENVTCETLQAEAAKPLQTLAVAPLVADVLTPDARDPEAKDAPRQNMTQRAPVLAALLNALGLRMYMAHSTKQGAGNMLLSPINTYGSLFAFFLGASKKTASSYQILLGVNRVTDRPDCVSLVDGHTVLKTLQSINSLVDDGPKDEIVTQVWTFAAQGAQLSEDFLQGVQDFSDASFTRAVNFSQTQEAQELVNSFVERTADGKEKVKDAFKDLSPGANLLFMSSFVFKGNWKTAFQPERTSMQEFNVDDNTTVMVPMMTHTGPFYYFKDVVKRCTVVKLALSKRSYMMLVLPNKGIKLRDIEGKLHTDVMANWHQALQEGQLELSLPKFSMSSMTDLRELLANMAAEVDDRLLGSEAEFDRLSSSKPFTIDKVLNKVQFEMSEEGAEDQDKNQEAGVPIKLTINRPFFFSITEGHSNAILMLGKITNPSL
ncbi:Angiotensinogen [Merluccius polli]|uniref:Angiotensinogen n=1 Tax=Merluccius polli TaxID=89951 RepID=A0AA47P2Y1_MERPO|nr:Angiotensinogen [Merluccius polli]